MEARIFSLHWDNIDPQIVAAQKAVFDYLQLPIAQHRIDGINHGEWIDWVMTRNDHVDVFLFIDIDCIPLSKARVDESFKKVAGGLLLGAEGSPNGIKPLRSYAGAWYVYINRKVWNALSRPSAKPTPHVDVCQLWTDSWQTHGFQVELIQPTVVIEPKWDLPGRPKGYGIGTTYSDHCFHLFEARLAANQKLFLERCKQAISS